MNKDILKKKILYRSNHRGTKEMDLLLGNFVKAYINLLNDKELIDLDKLLNIDDETLYKWYSGNEILSSIPNNNLTKKFKNYKL